MNLIRDINQIAEAHTRDQSLKSVVKNNDGKIMELTMKEEGTAEQSKIVAEFPDRESMLRAKKQFEKQDVSVVESTKGNNRLVGFWF